MNYENIFKSAEDKLEQKKQKKLKEYGLDDNSIKEFRSKIKQVSEDESNTMAFLLSNSLINMKSKLVNEKRIDYILEGANVNYIREKTPKRTLLELAIRAHNFEVCLALIKAGANINLYDVNLNQIYIKLSMEFNMPELLEILILLGANCNYKNLYIQKPPDYAKYLKQKNIEKGKDEKSIIKCIEILEKYTKTEEENEFINFLKTINTPKEKAETEVIEDAIKELEEAIDDCSKVLGENYQKKLRK